MKATELMIGDWVELNGVQIKVAGISYDCKEREFTIGFFDDNKEIYHAYKFWDSVTPIPITAEILIKNGFVLTDDSTDTYELNTDDYEVEAWYYGHGYWTIQVRPLTANKFDSGLTVTHCHGLQQFLRLCGVDKEIELQTT